ncbi:MAG: undecaprenyl-diphosphate phosphatase [Prevotellaceae bacterium]|jgi:undecaprenyl-diphosphatase|nr:undecaprenyl-diphosphate phosphatase [Prevotellaceae bacterium]
MQWWEALLLGLLQGLTEFLPVSSSGHLEIGNALFGVQSADHLTFTVVVHAATVCSTIAVLWREMAALLKGCARRRWNDETQYIAKIILSMAPVAVVGFFFKDRVEALFGAGLFVVGCGLLGTAALLVVAEYVRPRPKAKITFADALIIGLAQACAVIPGLSRSGTTIATGLLLKNKKETVAQFSFLMVLAPILGEAALDLLKGGFSEAAAGVPATTLVVGFLAAFGAGCIACKWMIELVKRGKLIYFALYCAIVGTVVLIAG